MEKPDNKKQGPLFTRRENGYGWDLNIGSRLSYVIIAIILGAPFAVVILCMILSRK